MLSSTIEWRRDLPVGAAAILIGLAIGWIDIHTTEVTATILPLILGGFAIGFWRPTRAWRWALLMTLGNPVVAGVGRMLQLQTAEPIRFDPLVYLVVILFAAAACYAGAMIRRLVRTRTQ